MKTLLDKNETHLALKSDLSTRSMLKRSKSHPNLPSKVSNIKPTLKKSKSYSDISKIQDENDINLRSGGSAIEHLRLKSLDTIIEDDKKVLDNKKSLERRQLFTLQVINNRFIYLLKNTKYLARYKNQFFMKRADAILKEIKCLNGLAGDGQFKKTLLTYIKDKNEVKPYRLEDKLIVSKPISNAIMILLRDMINATNEVTLEPWLEPWGGFNIIHREGKIIVDGHNMTWLPKLIMFEIIHQQLKSGALKFSNDTNEQDMVKVVDFFLKHGDNKTLDIDGPVDYIDGGGSSSYLWFKLESSDIPSDRPDKKKKLDVVWPIKPVDIVQLIRGYDLIKPVDIVPLIHGYDLNSRWTINRSLIDRLPSILLNFLDRVFAIDFKNLIFFLAYVL